MISLLWYGAERIWLEKIWKYNLQHIGHILLNTWGILKIYLQSLFVCFFLLMILLLLLLLSRFSRVRLIRVFSNESTLHMRWPKYWSFGLSISPSNEHPGLVSFRIDWLDLLVVQGTRKSLLQHHSSKASILQHSGFFIMLGIVGSWKWNFFKRWEYQTTWPASWEICIQVKKQRLELDMEKQTGSKSGKEYVKIVYCHPTYLTYMQSTSCKMPAWMKHKLESR